MNTSPHPRLVSVKLTRVGREADDARRRIARRQPPFSGGRDSSDDGTDCGSTFALDNDTLAGPQDALAISRRRQKAVWTADWRELDGNQPRVG